MFQRLSPEGKAGITLAQVEPARLGHRWLGTEMVGVKQALELTASRNIATPRWRS